MRWLLIEARLWRIAWRHRVADVLFGAHASLPFLAMLALPTFALAGIVGFAYWDGTQVQPARMATDPRATARALRRANELQCLAENVYFEARGEPIDGQYA